MPAHRCVPTEGAGGPFRGAFFLLGQIPGLEVGLPREVRVSRMRAVLSVWCGFIPIMSVVSVVRLCFGFPGVGTTRHTLFGVVRLDARVG